MGVLFLLWLLFGGVDTRVYCPPLWPEHTAVWSAKPQINGKDVKYHTEKDGTIVMYFAATTTITSAGIVQYQTGYATNTTAVEHNKRVRECQTINGDF